MSTLAITGHETMAVKLPRKNYMSDMFFITVSLLAVELTRPFSLSVFALN